ncbi:MAG: formate dehydrogenase accessory sulfurtransferase FdhD [Gemmatimonadota bacterium]
MPRTATLVSEVPVLLRVNDAPWASWSATPGGGRALVVGRMVADGLLHEAADLLDLHVSDDAAHATGAPATSAAAAALVAEARVTAAALERALVERAGRAAEGLAWYLAAGRLPTRERALPLPSPDALRDLFRALFADTDARHPGGGVHAAALTDGAGLLLQVEDVGRHNAVDRAVGRIHLDGLDAGGLGLVLSSRVSGEAALKAARAGVAWVASRSAATTLAAALAAAAGLPLVARAAGPAAEVLGEVP